MKTVLVTGSAKGLGASLIKEFAKNGYNVVICYNNSERDSLKLKKYVENTYNVEASTTECDITDETEINYMLDKFKIDVLINNAAVSMDNNIMDKTKEEFMKVLEVNLVGTFIVSKEALKRGVKSIINISSTDAVDTYSKLNIDYSASKSGINILTKTLSLSYPKKRIIGIMPNWINTESVREMNPSYLKKELKRIGQKKLLESDDVAKRIYQIFTDKKILSGDIIRVDYEGE